MKANSSQLSLALTSLALGIATSFPQSVSAATLYSVLDLSFSPVFDIVAATAINDLGQVVGISVNNSAFRTAPNSPINPVTDNLGRIISSRDINNSGEVVAVDPVSNRSSAGILIDANRLAVNLFPVTNSNAINDSGQIAGTGLVAGCNGFGCSQPGVFNAVRVDNSNTATRTIVDLGTLGGIGSRGNGINELGQVVGSSRTTDGETHAFRTAPNSVINSVTDDLGTLGGSFSTAIDINNLGQVVVIPEQRTVKLMLFVLRLIA